MPRLLRVTDHLPPSLMPSLAPLTLTTGSTLLQYVDDLIASPAREQCEKDTIALLLHLEGHGHNASLSKLQFVLQSVILLGHMISGDRKTLSPKRIKAITSLPKPITKNK